MRMPSEFQAAVGPSAGARRLDRCGNEFHGAGAVLDGRKIKPQLGQLLAEATSDDCGGEIGVEDGKCLLVALGVADLGPLGARGFRLQTRSAALVNDVRLARPRMI